MILSDIVLSHDHIDHHHNISYTIYTYISIIVYTFIIAKKLQPLILLALKSGVELQVIDSIGVSDMRTRNLLKLPTSSSSSSSSAIKHKDDIHHNHSSSNDNAFNSHITINETGNYDRHQSNNNNLNKTTTSTATTISDKTIRTLKKAFLHVDAYRIDQVIRNLISNAVKFTPANNKVIVSFELDEVKNSFHPLSVAEEAVGILRIKVIL